MPGFSREDCVLARAARMIVEGRTEEAIEGLSRFYEVLPPRVKVGLPRRCRNALGCYTPQDQTIYLRSSREYRDPFIVLHEFYHHLRWRLGSHRGTERHADEFAARAVIAMAEGACSTGGDGSEQGGE
ncbi:hypothetical protein [Stetteria hydrogenophila]